MIPVNTDGCNLKSVSPQWRNSGRSSIFFIASPWNTLKIRGTRKSPGQLKSVQLYWPRQPAQKGLREEELSLTAKSSHFIFSPPSKIRNAFWIALPFSYAIWLFALYEKNTPNIQQHTLWYTALQRSLSGYGTALWALIQLHRRSF